MRKSIKNYGKKLASMIAVAALAFTTVVGTTGCGESSNATETKTEEAAADKQETADTTESSGGSLTKVRYATMTGSTTQWFGIIGQEKGIWEKYGLDVVVTEFANGIETVNTLATGQADIGFVTDFAGLNRFGNTEGDSDLKFFEEQCKTTSYSLVVDPSKISKIEDLKGKNFLVSKGTFLEYLNAVTLEQAGLTKDDVTEVPVEGGPSILAAAESGQADAIWTAGDNLRRLVELGWKIIKNQSEIGVNTYVFHVASEKYLKENAETAQNFIKGYEEVNQYVRANMDEAADIITKKFGVEKEMFVKTVEASEVIPELTKESVDALKEIDAWAVKNGFYKANLNITDYIYTDALKAVYPDNVTV